jgi:enediyne biosynthesis protein E4
VWIDFDGDGRLDLVTAGDWMPLRFFRNEGNRFRDVTESVGLGAMRGRWYSLAVGDFNGDGRPDIVAGNLGLNQLYTTSRDADDKLSVYAGDFTGSGRTDIVLTERNNGRDYPVLGFGAIARTIYTVGTKYSTYAAFSTASIDQLFSTGQLRSAVRYEVDTLASVYLQNNGNGTFTATALPRLAQIAPIRGIVATDVDGDGNLDLIVAGNLYGTEPNTPRADAGTGLWLRGDGRGHFTAVPPVESGFFAPLDVTGLALVKTPTGNAVVVANYGDSLSVFTLQRPRRR